MAVSSGKKSRLLYESLTYASSVAGPVLIDVAKPLPEQAGGAFCYRWGGPAFLSKLD